MQCLFSLILLILYEHKFEREEGVRFLKIMLKGNYEHEYYYIWPNTKHISKKDKKLHEHR